MNNNHNFENMNYTVSCIDISIHKKYNQSEMKIIGGVNERLKTARRKYKNIYKVK